MTEHSLKGKTLHAVFLENKDHEYSVHLYNEDKSALYYVSPLGTKDSVKRKSNKWAKEQCVKIVWSK